MINKLVDMLKKLFYYFLLFTGIILSTSHLGDNYMGISDEEGYFCLLYTSPSPRDRTRSRMPSSA